LLQKIKEKYGDVTLLSQEDQEGIHTFYQADFDKWRREKMRVLHPIARDPLSDGFGTYYAHILAPMGNDPDYPALYDMARVLWKNPTIPYEDAEYMMKKACQMYEERHWYPFVEMNFPTLKERGKLAHEMANDEDFDIAKLYPEEITKARIQPWTDDDEINFGAPYWNGMVPPLDEFAKQPYWTLVGTRHLQKERVLKKQLRMKYYYSGA